MATVRKAAQDIISRLSKAVVVDCPPELAACEVCGRFECLEDEWLRCEKRLAVKRQLQTGASPAVDKSSPTHVQPPMSFEEANTNKTGPAGHS